MGFPLYGHSGLWMLINIILAFFGFIPLLILINHLKNTVGQKSAVKDILLLGIFIYFIPHSLYLGLELPKHLQRLDGILDYATLGGILTFGFISLCGLLSCIAQIYLAITKWEEYRSKNHPLIVFLLANLIISGAVFGTLIGLQGINFYHAPIQMLRAALDIIALNDSHNKFIGLGVFKLNLILTWGLWITLLVILKIKKSDSCLLKNPFKLFKFSKPHAF